VTTAVIGAIHTVMVGPVDITQLEVEVEHTQQRSSSISSKVEEVEVVVGAEVDSIDTRRIIIIIIIINRVGIIKDLRRQR
jgi:hypothetical protein